MVTWQIFRSIMRLGTLWGQKERSIWVRPECLRSASKKPKPTAAAAHQREISTNNKTNCSFLIDAKNQHLPKVHYTGTGVENWYFHFWSGDFWPRYGTKLAFAIDSKEECIWVEWAIFECGTYPAMQLVILSIHTHIPGNCNAIHWCCGKSFHQNRPVIKTDNCDEKTNSTFWSQIQWKKLFSCSVNENATPLITNPLLRETRAGQ